MTEAITVDRITGGDYARGYSARVDLEVYQLGVPSETGGVFAGSGTNVYDDAIFGGPYINNSNPLTLTGMGIGFILPAVIPDPNGDTLYTRVSFYPNHDAAGSPYSYTGTPVVALLNWGGGWTTGGTPGSARYYSSSISFSRTIATLTTADVFDGGPSDRTAGVKIEPFQDAAYTIRAVNFQVVRRAGFTGCKVGSSDAFGWFSTSADVASGEVTNRSGGGTNARGTFMGFLASIPNDPWVPPDLGVLADGSASPPASSLSGGNVRWYRFTIAGGATDTLGAFLDLDCEGSTGDLSTALYNGNQQSADFGDVIAWDEESGSGVNPMLSFGMGRRAAVGDGRQYDGRNTDGSRGLSAGTYYVAIAPAGSVYSDGFGVVPGTLPAPAQAQLNIRTNVNGRVLAASVAPAIGVGDNFAGPIVAPGIVISGQAVPLTRPRWLRIENCHGASNAEPVTLHWDGTSTVAGVSATFFDVFGNLVNQQSWSGIGGPPAFVYDSNNPLPAGPLYLALAHAGVEVQPTSPETNGRWHLRGVGGANMSIFAGRLEFVNTDCCTPGNVCGVSDFNGDGDFGTDQDIEAFFACLAGNCCFTCYCGGADFNGDGDVGTDADIESFFRVLAGGSC